jgi:sn-glycerol 3-phosphate transport system permease protein
MTIDALTMPMARAAGARRFSAKAIGGHAVLALLSIACLFPIYWMMVTSLRPQGVIFETSLLPSALSIEHYAYALEALPISRMLINTFVVSSVVTILQVVTGLFAAYAFSRWRFPFARIIYVLIALTWLVPLQVVMIPNYLLVVRLGLLDTLTALVLPHFAAALAVMMLTQAMRAFPNEVIEAARMDGAGAFRTLWEIVVPNLRGVIVSLAILIFVSTWNEYFWPLLLTRSPDNSVIQIGLQMFITDEGTNWGPMMAAATAASAPVLLLYVFMQRQVIQSFMKSGLR